MYSKKVGKVVKLKSGKSRFVLLWQNVIQISDYGIEVYIYNILSMFESSKESVTVIWEKLETNF